MKKLYEKPKIVIELFSGQDIVTFSGGGNGGGEEGWDRVGGGNNDDA